MAVVGQGPVPENGAANGWADGARNVPATTGSRHERQAWRLRTARVRPVGAVRRAAAVRAALGSGLARSEGAPGGRPVGHLVGAQRCIAQRLPDHPEIADRSDGGWKPSPGSIYPTLQQLEDEGLVRAESADGKRVYHLTEDGQAYVAEHAEEVSSPWQTRSGAESGDDALKPLIGQIAAAIWQIASVGTPLQQARGREALIETAT